MYTMYLGPDIPEDVSGSGQNPALAQFATTRGASAVWRHLGQSIQRGLILQWFWSAWKWSAWQMILPIQQSKLIKIFLMII